MNKEDEFDHKKGIIIIVEDNLYIQTIEMEYLQQAGYKNFILTNDGRQGIEAAYTHRPDMIICDLNMPGMRGMSCTMNWQIILKNTHIISLDYIIHTSYDFIT